MLLSKLGSYVYRLCTNDVNVPISLQRNSPKLLSPFLINSYTLAFLHVIPISPWKRLESSIGKRTCIRKRQGDHARWKTNAGILPRGLHIATCGKQIGMIKTRITNWCPFPHHSYTLKVDTLLPGLILKFDPPMNGHTWFSNEPKCMLNWKSVWYPNKWY